MVAFALDVDINIINVIHFYVSLLSMTSER